MEETICNICNKDFKNKTKLKRHQGCKYKCKVHTISNDNINREDAFKKEDIIKLFNEFEKKDITKDEVIELLQTFYNSTKNEETQNNQDINNEKESQYICDDCKKPFAQRQGLYKHKKLNRCKVKIVKIDNSIQNNSAVVNNTNSNNTTNITNITNNSNDTYNINLHQKVIINVNPLGLETYEHISIKDFKKIFKKVDTLMDNLCYHIFNRHIPNISFYKNNLNQKLVLYLTKNLEIERVDENEFCIELKHILEDMCIQLFHNFKNELSKDELVSYMRTLVEYQNSMATTQGSSVAKKTKTAIQRIMDFAFRNKDIKIEIDSIIRNLKENIEHKKQLQLKHKQENLRRINNYDEFYLKESNIPDNLIHDSKLLCKLKNIAEEENKKADKAHIKRLLTSLDNVNFTNDEN